MRRRSSGVRLPAMASACPPRAPVERWPSAAIGSRRRQGPGEWDLRFGDSAAAGGWDRLSSHAPGPALTAWSTLQTDPRARSQRQHPLKGDFATRSVGGRDLEQWQYEVSGGGADLVLHRRRATRRVPHARRHWPPAPDRVILSMTDPQRFGRVAAPDLCAVSNAPQRCRLPLGNTLGKLEDHGGVAQW